jgi:hypothetical protein
MASVELFDGLHPHTLNFQEGASPAGFLIGDLVKLDTSGQVVLATAGKVLGIAQKSYTGTQATLIPVDVIDFDDFYVMSVAAASVTAQADVGQEANVTFTAGAQTIAAADDGLECIIFGIDPRFAVGTTGAAGGKYIVRFNAQTLEPMSD